MPRSGFSSIREMPSPPGDASPAIVPMTRETTRKTFVLMDVRGVIVYVDPAMALKFGSDPQSLSGKHISDLIKGERFDSLIRKVAKTGIPQKLSGAWLPVVPEDGAGKNECYLLPITADSGKVTGVVFCRVARPLSETVHAADNREKKFKTLFDSISIPILIVEKRGLVLDCNPAAREYLGAFGTDLAGMTLCGLARSGWDSVIDTGIEHAGKNGWSRFEVPLRGKPEKNGMSGITLRMVEYGDIPAFLAEIRDLPGGAPAAERDGEHWRAVLDALPTAALLWRKRGDTFRLARWNAAAVDITGGAVLDWRDKPAGDIRIGHVTAGAVLARAEAGTEILRIETEAFDRGCGSRRARVAIGPVRRGLALMCVEEAEDPEKGEHDLLALKTGLKSIAEEVTLAEERERLRIAADIHDGVSQALAVIHFRLEELEAGMAPGESRELAGRIREHVLQAIHSARSLSTGLCPPVLRERGLEAAVEWLIGRFREEHGISACFSSDGTVNRLEWHLEVLLFKMLRELLQNAGKHSRAKRVNVFLRNAGGRVQVTVEDDGIGFDPSMTNPSKGEGGFGLYSIRERLRYVGGECTIDSALHQGTRCTVNIPIGNGWQP